MGGKVNKMLCVNRKQTRNRIPYYPIFEKTIKPRTVLSGTEYLILGVLRKGKCTSRMEREGAILRQPQSVRIL